MGEINLSIELVCTYSYIVLGVSIIGSNKNDRTITHSLITYLNLIVDYLLKIHMRLSTRGQSEKKTALCNVTTSYAPVKVMFCE